jgi:dTDP-4-amino-4,6-dideoxygalactose transaminase
MGHKPVPFFDLSRAVNRVREGVESRWHNVLSNTSFVGGKEVSAFEQAFAGFVGAEACVALNSGTDGLILALKALGLESGDEVLVPDFTFIATAEAVVLAGGRPVIVDVEPGSLNLDAGKARAAVGPRTVGVIGVHLYGRPFDASGIQNLCREKGLWLVEDAAQAHGAALEDHPVGSFGELAAWSFYPSKNLGCFGDGGAVTGSDLDLVEKTRRLANHGSEERYKHAVIGTNSRMDALQAAVLNERLPLLADDNRRRRAIARRYRECLQGVGDIGFLEDPPAAKVVYHQMVVRTSRRDELVEALGTQGIGTAVHYPIPLHAQPAMAAYADSHDLYPESTRAASEVVSLPCFAELQDDEVEQVCRAVREFFA